MKGEATDRDKIFANIHLIKGVVEYRVLKTQQ